MFDELYHLLLRIVRSTNLRKSGLSHVFANLPVNYGGVRVLVIFQCHINVLPGDETRRSHRDNDEELIHNERQVNYIPHQEAQDLGPVNHQQSRQDNGVPDAQTFSGRRS